mmetsp:Transcript_27794/g.44463  ORF Transcript_27794/g.44463 Transcript_27794/m.44463 type:complete len:693 (+) Transcript_27794:2050-4128(+)
MPVLVHGRERGLLDLQPARRAEHHLTARLAHRLPVFDLEFAPGGVRGDALAALCAVEAALAPALVHGVDGLPVNLLVAGGADALRPALVAARLAVLHEAGQGPALRCHGGVALAAGEALRVPRPLDQVGLQHRPDDGQPALGADVLGSAGLVQQQPVGLRERLVIQRLPALGAVEALGMPSPAQCLPGGSNHRLPARLALGQGAGGHTGGAPRTAEARQTVIRRLVARGGQGAIGELDGAVGEDDGVVGQPHGPGLQQEAAVRQQLRAVQKVESPVGVWGREGAIRAPQSAIRQLHGAVRQPHGAVGQHHHPVRQRNGAVGHLHGPRDLVLQVALPGAGPLGEPRQCVGRQHVPGLGRRAVRQQDAPVGVDDGAVGREDGAVHALDPAVRQQDGAVAELVRAVRVRLGEGAVGQHEAAVGQLDGAVGQQHRAVRAQDHPVRKPLRPVRQVDSPRRQLRRPEARQVELRQLVARGRDRPVGAQHGPVGLHDGPVGLQDVAVRPPDVAVGEQHRPVRQLVRPVRQRLGHRAVLPPEPPIQQLDGAVGHLHGAVLHQHHPVGQQPRPVLELLRALRDALAAREARQVVCGRRVGGGLRGAVRHAVRAVRELHGAVRQQHLPIRPLDDAVGQERRAVQQLVGAVDLRLHDRPVRPHQAAVRQLDGPIGQGHLAVGVQHHAVGEALDAVLQGHGSLR